MSTPFSPAIVGLYHIERELGGGGMSRVFLATDKKLDRQVVIKILPPELAQGISVERFDREIRLAARLQHPNIVPLLNAGSADGLAWYTMPFVRGDSLRARMSEGRIERRLALRLIADVARALRYAHGAGILHRDIKPGNILLSEGVAVVTDFGIAKAIGAAHYSNATPSLTQCGSPIGTPAYMAPEQAAGESDPGHHADLYALGVVAYELLAGQHPFPDKRTPRELMVAHFLEKPSALAQHAPDLPPGVCTLVMQCLEKDPAARPASAAAMLDALEAAATGVVERATTSLSAEDPTQADIAPIPTFRGRPAIAVVPFENCSSDPDQQFFADGIAEDLITRLSTWRSYPVIARHASFSLQLRAMAVKEIAAKLGARYIVQGSVRKSGARVRIAAQLVDADTAQQLWGETYDRDLTDVFAVQDEISQAIAVPLLVDVQRAEFARVRRHPESLDAWELYHRAQSLMHTFTEENLARARALLERAVTVEPQFAPPWSALAEVAMHDVMGGWTKDPARLLEVAVRHARRGIELEPRDGEAHTALALALMMTGDRFGALESSRRALELNPSLPRALTLYAYNRQIAGHPPDQSIEMVHRAMRLSPHDPYEWLFYDVLSSSYFNAGRFAEGLDTAQRLITISPTYYWGYLYSAMSCVGLGRRDEARAFVQQAREIQPGVSFELARTCLGTMAPDVECRFLAALRAAGLD
jgi:serine/threonine-protein kinase